MGAASRLDGRFARRFLARGRGGKSGLRRAERRVTPGRREATESATESKPPMARKRTGKVERVR